MTDQTIIEKKLKGQVASFGSSIFKFSKTIEVFGNDPAYNNLILTATGPWNQFTYTGTGPAFVFHELKDARITGFHVIGGDVVFRAVASSSRNVLQSVRVQNGDMVFDAPNGADLSKYTLIECETMSGTMRWRGSNNLAPLLIACTSSETDNGFDFTEGGSGATLLHCGGSKAKTLVRVNGGYQLFMSGGRSELCETLIEATYNGPTPLVLENYTADEVRHLIVGKAGNISNVWHNSENVSYSISTKLGSQKPLSEIQDGLTSSN